VWLASDMSGRDNLLYQLPSDVARICYAGTVTYGDGNELYVSTGQLETQSNEYQPRYKPK